MANTGLSPSSFFKVALSPSPPLIIESRNVIHSALPGFPLQVRLAKSHCSNCWLVLGQVISLSAGLHFRRRRTRKESRLQELPQNYHLRFRTAHSVVACEAECAPCFEVKDLGLKGFGVVASEAISQGRCVLEEKPLFVVEQAGEPSDWREADIEALISSCSREGQASFWNLADSHAEDPSKKTAKGIALTNSYSLETSDSEDEDEDASEDAKSAAGVFAVASRFNHSCTPNLHAVWRPDLGADVRHALCDLEKDEELTISYLGLSDLLSPAAERRETLRKRWKFQCRCKACSLEGDALKLSDERRVRMLKLHDILSNSPAPSATSEAPLNVTALVDETVQLIDEEMSGNPNLKSRAYLSGFQLAAHSELIDLAMEMCEDGAANLILSEGATSAQAIALKDFIQNYYEDEDED
eukprot:TRINITY_DN17156_c0_g1_i1.p1 TRINITY_DN17156_c0_g1~~TRINITY_DN17156_c0_g1_i1.p1  ORF type:complete len:413 (-),score=63.98 TRINITY_DN17156_c0_g1_i1:194-1432(-)